MTIIALSQYTTTIDWCNPAHMLLISVLIIVLLSGAAAVDSVPKLEVPFGLLLFVMLFSALASIIILVCQHL